MEDAAQGARNHDQVDVPDLDAAGPEEVDDPEGEQGNTTIGNHHHAAAIPAIHQGAHERTQEHFRQQRCQGRGGEHGRRPGRLSDPPDEGELRQPATEEGKCLPGPDGKKRHCPVARLLHNVTSKYESVTCIYLGFRVKTITILIPNFIFVNVCFLTTRRNRVVKNTQRGFWGAAPKASTKIPRQALTPNAQRTSGGCA
ncbi:MAG: hypothetical protein BWY25_02460 [Chloroflexi bacterium ADurb.Bin222]|nr:MAG: hypothetical protein BWY25_02460 [Chloroflexi bacterium ADurb.Bin222]